MIDWDLPFTDAGLMIGDFENLDWMDFENLKNDVMIGHTIGGKHIILIVKFMMQIKKREFKNFLQCFVWEPGKGKDIWRGHRGGINFMEIDNIMTKKQFNFLSSLTDHNLGVIEECHRPIETSYIGKSIGTPTCWRRKKAVEIIERNWIICRYDPRYKICGDVLMHNIEEAREEYLSSLHE